MRQASPALDRFRLLAAVLVVCNHTAPLSGLFPAADFVLTRVLARTAVPFFLMVSGYFLSQKNGRHAWAFWKKAAVLYGVCILLYLPLNLYAGQLHGDFLRRLLADGTFYHLWYFPCCWACPSPGPSAAWDCGPLCSWRGRCTSSAWAATAITGSSRGSPLSRRDTA